MENKSLSTYDSYTGPNAMEHFFEAINRYRILMEELFNEEGKKKFLEKREDIKKHYAAKTCHIGDGEIKCPNKNRSLLLSNFFVVKAFWCKNIMPLQLKNISAPSKSNPQASLRGIP